MQIGDSKRYPAQKYANGNSCYLSGRFHYWIAQSRCCNSRLGMQKDKLLRDHKFTMAEPIQQTFGLLKPH